MNWDVGDVAEPQEPGAERVSPHGVQDARSACEQKAVVTTIVEQKVAANKIQMQMSTNPFRDSM